MKTITLALLAALLAVGEVRADVNTKCVSVCSSHVLQATEKDCAPYRSELPRPDLYNHCVEGHSQGRNIACKLLCTGSDSDHHSRQLDSRRLDACAQFSGRPPPERVTACNEGYVLARARALSVIQERRLTEAKPDPVLNAKAEAKDEPEAKRKLSVNSQTSPKSVLEAAREEAAAAFQEAKSAEL